MVGHFGGSDYHFHRNGVNGDVGNRRGSCVIGCAYVSVTCNNPGAAYGVNWVTYKTNAVSQSNLVSHELGHNVGSSHDAAVSANTGFIMYPSNSASTRTFSDQSVTAFKRAANDVCITVAAEQPQGPTSSPTTSPTAVPTPAPVPTAPPVPAPTPAPVGPQCSDLSSSGGGACKNSPLNCRWSQGSCLPN